jgi:hypothetical protein
MAFVPVDKAVACHPNDIGHLEGWLIHFFTRFRERLDCSGLETAIASSGLLTACRCRCDKWRYTSRMPACLCVRESCSRQRLGVEYRCAIEVVIMAHKRVDARIISLQRAVSEWYRSDEPSGSPHATMRALVALKGLLPNLRLNLGPNPVQCKHHDAEARREQDFVVEFEDSGCDCDSP